MHKESKAYNIYMQIYHRMFQSHKSFLPTNTHCQHRNEQAIDPPQHRVLQPLNHTISPLLSVKRQPFGRSALDDPWHPPLATWVPVTTSTTSQLARLQHPPRSGVQVQMAWMIVGPRLLMLMLSLSPQLMTSTKRELVKPRNERSS